MSEHMRIAQQQYITGKPLCLSEADFHECLVQFFRPFVSIRPMDWTCIQKSETYFAPFFKFKRLVNLYFDYIFGLFEDFRNTDTAVIELCLKKYYRFVVYNCGFPVPDPKEFPHLEYDMMTYTWTTYTKLVPQSIEELLSRPILYQDPVAVMRFIRYFAPYNIHTIGLLWYTRHVRFSILSDPFPPDKVKYKRFIKMDGMGRRRFKLLLMTLDFVLKVRIKNCQNHIKGLRLLFQAIPDPYITWQEIFRFLRRRLAPRESQRSYIKSFQESCTVCFPECQRVLKPRSLKHLARCKVRRCLGLALPHGVWGLQLPNELADYVLLQRRKDQFLPVIHPLSNERVFSF